MELPANSVTQTSPASTDEIVIDQDVTIYRNPATMPEMTTTETQIATQIEQNNPAVDPDPETGKTRIAAKTIARRCIKAVQLAEIAGLDPSMCGSMPIFVTGANAFDTAVNDEAAIEDYPKWVLLHNWDSGPKDTSWYRDKKFDNGPGCLKADKTKLNYVDPEGRHCDEYPFGATIQGYKGPLGDNKGDGPGPVPRIMWTHGSHNSLQGRALQHFFGTSPTGEFTGVFPSCNIRKLTTAEVEAAKLLPIPPEMTLIASGFLNVPIGRYVPRSKTVGLCNKPPVP